MKVNTSQQYVSDLAFEADPRRQQELRGRPIADALYRKLISPDIAIRRFDGTVDWVLDKRFALDVQIRLPSGMMLYGQEKFLSWEYAKYASLTIEYQQNQFTGEQGDWFKLPAQFYFVGYFTKVGTAFWPWALVDWPALVLATNNGSAMWQENANHDGFARASFRYIRIRDLPAKCVIAWGYEW